MWRVEIPGPEMERHQPEKSGWHFLMDAEDPGHTLRTTWLGNKSKKPNS